jgi:hypothetical protein
MIKGYYNMTLRSTAKSKEQPETTTSDPPVKPSKGFYNITGNGSYIIRIKGFLYYKNQRCLIL